MKITVPKSHTLPLAASVAQSTMVRRLFSPCRIEQSSQVSRVLHRRRCLFCTSCRPLLLPSPSSPRRLIQQTGEVITRLGPSARVPGLQGVYLTKAVKKFHPIEVLPCAATATPSIPSSTMARHEHASSFSSASPDMHASAKQTSLMDNTTLAPPLVVNLAFAPLHSISLRRFLALRHMFSSASYLHSATDHGWYLIAPSSAAPLCADVAGLEKWVRLHHHRYVQQASSPSSSNTTSRVASSASPREVRPAKHAELAKLEAALDNGEELTEAELRALMEKETQINAKELNDDEDGEGDDDGGDDLLKDEEADADGDASHRRTLRAGAASPPADVESAPTVSASPPQLRSVPPLIPEAHLFDINDGVPWDLPPADDLANHEYWKGHRQRMALYESTGDADAAEQREALLQTLRSDPRSRACSEQELYAAADVLFHTLKHKANVVVSVDGETGLLTLVPLQDLTAGEELLLHYGREWWTGRMLSSLLLAVSDADMSQIRWIEQLFGHLADTNELFPMLIPARQKRKHASDKRRHLLDKAPQTPDASIDALVSGDRSVQEAKATHSPDDDALGARKQQRGGPLVLYNTVTRSPATDAAVLAFAVRRSCVHSEFFDRLVLGDPARDVQPIFHLATPDAEVSMDVLRRVLLASLRGVRDNEGAALADGGSLRRDSRAHKADDDESVFSV